MLNLDARFYVSPDTFAQERRAIFARTWQHLGAASQVSEPHSYIAADIAGFKVFVQRGSDGMLRGFKNMCRHRGAQLLADGTGQCKAVRCPYHQWLFNEKGELLSAPWFGDDPPIKVEDWPLEPIHVAEWRGLLFAAINPQESLLEQLGELPAELADEPIENYALDRTDKVHFDANWKVYTDNFVEGYHIPGIHPSFHAAIDFKQFATTAHKGFVRMTCPPREGLFYRGKWLWMWPNWTLSLFEGGMNTSRINPLGVNRTEQLYSFYFADITTATQAARDKTISGNLAVVREDYGVCVGTHKNYETGLFTTGPLSSRHERGVHYFQSRVAEAIGVN
jgi:choline monooxygenase